MSNRSPKRSGHLLRARWTPSAPARWFASRSVRNGVSMPIVLFALVALLGVTALSVDVGQVFVAVQRAQNVADAAALAGAPLLASSATATSTATTIATANNDHAGAYTVVCNYANPGPSDIIYYPPGSTAPGIGQLGPYAAAMSVTCHVDVNLTFARVLGLTHQVCTRQAMVLRAPLGGTPISPMWVDASTPYSYGVAQNLLMAGAPCFPGIPGNFGWLALPSGVSASWIDVLSGLQLSESDLKALFVNIGDKIWGSTGLVTGQWSAALQSRLDRADQPPWAGETFDSYSSDNPRIIVIPMVNYLGGTGANAHFSIQRFGAFWLESIKKTGSPKGVTGRFIQYTLPGGGADPLSDDTGLFTYRLVG